MGKRGLFTITNLLQVAAAAFLCQGLCAEIIYSTDFQDQTLGTFTTENLGNSNVEWFVRSHNSSDYYAYANSFGQGSGASEDWLISQSFNFDNYTGETLDFDFAGNFGGPDLVVYIGAYTGLASTTSWTELLVLPTNDLWDFFPHSIDLSSFNGTQNIAFKYTSDSPAGGDGIAAEIDNFVVSGTAVPEPTYFALIFATLLTGFAFYRRKRSA